MATTMTTSQLQPPDFSREALPDSRGSRPRSHANFLFSENSGGIAILQYLENLGGDMARPRIKNLTSPIFDNF